MNFIKMESREQLDNLKKGDLLVVKWRETSRVYKNYGVITHNNIYGIINTDEVLLNKRLNTYFNIDLYLQGRSYAKEVYLVKEGDK